MKQPNSNSARLEFSSPEINVGLAAASKPRKRPSPSMPKNKGIIMVKDSKPAAPAKAEKPAKRIPKRIKK